VVGSSRTDAAVAGGGDVAAYVADSRVVEAFLVVVAVDVLDAPEAAGCYGAFFGVGWWGGCHGGGVGGHGEAGGLGEGSDEAV